MVQTIWAFIKTIYEMFTANELTIIIGIMAILGFIIPIKKKKAR